MKVFSLSSFEPLPCEIKERGKTYEIRSDYRTILRIFRMLNDSEIMAEDKPLLLRKMFFVNQTPKRAEAAEDAVQQGGQAGRID